MSNAFEESASRLMAGETPKTRDNVSDCLLAVLGELVKVYMVGGTSLSLELDALLEASKNSDDAFYSDLGVMQRQAIWTARNVLIQTKANQHAKETTGNDSNQSV